jgi:hypothetical protein
MNCKSTAGILRPRATPPKSVLCQKTACSTHWPHVFGPLGAALVAFELPPQLLHDLLDAFVQDTLKSATAESYASHAELLDYCRRSANPVGRLLLHLYGVTDALALERSDAICSALQLINFWQDLSVDIPRGRYYLPTGSMPSALACLHDDILALRQTEWRYTSDSVLCRFCEGQHAIWHPTCAPNSRPGGLGAAPRGPGRDCAFWIASRKFAMQHSPHALPFAGGTILSCCGDRCGCNGSSPSTGESACTSRPGQRVDCQEGFQDPFNRLCSQSEPQIVLASVTVPSKHHAINSAGVTVNTSSDSPASN